MKVWRIFGGKSSVNFPEENRLKFCHQKFRHILRCKKRDCHLELTLGASSPKDAPRSLWISNVKWDACWEESELAPKALKY